MHIKQTALEVTVEAPAKINLFLEVLGKRPDGFHELETLMVPATVFDTLTFRPRADSFIQLRCEWAVGLQAAQRCNSAEMADTPFGDLPTDEKNIVYRAAKLLAQESGQALGAEIEVIKRIPSSAGLGGASSDAAATLLAGNLAWDLKLSLEKLHAMASALGSDIPFFLFRGAAICRGRGELIETIPSRRLQAVIVRPPVGLPTPQVFRHCTPTTSPEDVSTMTEAICSGNPQQMQQGMTNRLEPAASQITPWIQTLQQAFDSTGAMAHQMSGSGSSYFGLFHHAKQARRTAQWLRSQQLGLVYEAETLVI